jgi:hypothetical protein
MRLLILPLALAGCNTVGFGVISMEPIYGWVDGCTDVKVSGHGFDPDASATLGGVALTDLTQPDGLLDEGYQLFGRTPPSPTGATGYADLTVTSGGESGTLAQAFWYAACPGAGFADGADPAEVTEGATVTLSGCGLDPATQAVRVGTSAALPIEASCGTARATFTAPGLPAGTWYVGVFDLAGTQIFPDPACDITQPVATGDTAEQDTATPDPCAGAPTLAYGGAA